MVEINSGRAKGKRFWRGTLNLKVSDATRLILGYALPDGADAKTVSVKVDFVPVHPLKARSEIAMSHYKEGLLNTEIKDIMGISKSMVTKLINFWYTSRNMKMPDGRGRRSTLKKKHTVAPVYQEISDHVMELMDEGMLLQDIAQTLGRDRNTITQAAKFYCESRDMEYEDGRNRRKSLNPKSNG